MLMLVTLAHHPTCAVVPHALCRGVAWPHVQWALCRDSVSTPIPIPKANIQYPNYKKQQQHVHIHHSQSEKRYAHIMVMLVLSFRVPFVIPIELTASA